MDVQPAGAQESAPDSAAKSTPQPQSRLEFAFTLSILLQVLFGFVGLIATDGGGMLQLWTFSFFGYWAGVVVIFKRRKTGNLTKGDLVFIRIGFLAIMYLVAPFVAVLVWYLRGYLQ